MPMVGEIFKDRPQPPERTALSRDLTALLVSGPAGATDPVLWTLLLSREPAAAAKRQRRQPRERPPLPAFRAVFAGLLRAAFARGP